WTIITFIFFGVLFAGPVCYLQILQGARSKSAVLLNCKSNFPLLSVGGISSITANIFRGILNGVYITYALSFILFSLYNCDGKICVGSHYIWGSCHNEWSEGNWDTKSFLLGQSRRKCFSCEFSRYFFCYKLFLLTHLYATVRTL
ncbi:unnamed protein product, partial [Dicrocoelium dendriticum]